MNKHLIKILMPSLLILLLSPFPKAVAKEITTRGEIDKVTREANGILTWYGDWVYHWGRNEAEKETQITNAFFREKLDGSGKVMLSDWNEQVNSSDFDIENESIYYLGKDYKENNWRYFLKRMDLDGKNKEIVLDHVSFGDFEVEGKWFYQIGYDTENCPHRYEDYRPGVMYRTNLETKKTILLKKCIYPRLGTITKKGLYLDDEFFPISNTKSEKSNLKNVWKQIGYESNQNFEIDKDSIFPDRGTIFYIIWSRQELKQYLFKYKEQTKKAILIKDLPSPKEGPYLRMVNVHRGFAYFEAFPYGSHGRGLYRIPLDGGELKKVLDIPDRTTYSFINNHVFFFGGNYEILSRIPLTKKTR